MTVGIPTLQTLLRWMNPSQTNCGLPLTEAPAPVREQDSNRDLPRTLTKTQHPTLTQIIHVTAFTQTPLSLTTIICNNKQTCLFQKYLKP